MRDRAVFYVALLKGFDCSVKLAGLEAKQLLLDPMDVPLRAISSCLRHYLCTRSEESFSVATVTVDPELILMERHQTHIAASHSSGTFLLETVENAPSATAASMHSDAELLSRMPQFVHLGARFTSAKRAALSESGTEYEVTCIKHVYASHMLLQFHLANTLEDQLLENVRVAMDLSGIPGLELDSELHCDSLPYGQSSSSYTALRFLSGVPVGSIACTLIFNVKDVDPARGEPDKDDAGYQDEYQLEELELVAADFMRQVSTNDFRTDWDKVGGANEVVETFSLSYFSLKHAMDAVIEFLGMQVSCLLLPYTPR